jgi:hypothetical protein
MGGITRDASGSWRFEMDPAALRSALGSDVLTAFCSCFVHSDRLVALTDFGSMSLKRHGEMSVAHTRNLYAMYWLVAGTLRELALSVRQLRSALAKAQLLGDHLGEPWKELQAIERWEDDPTRRDIRNRVAFHVDPKAIARGLDELIKVGDRVVVTEGDGPEMYRSFQRLGLEAALQGLGIAQEDLVALVPATAVHQQVPFALQKVFHSVMRACGLGTKEGAATK